MARPQRAWVFDAGKKKPSSLPDSVKAEVSRKATSMIDAILKPKYVQPPPTDDRFNYISDIKSKWIGSKFYLISIYSSPGPNALSPTFEARFAQMAYSGNQRFKLSFMRHTGKWHKLFSDLTADECLEAIKDGPWFQP